MHYTNINYTVDWEKQGFSCSSQRWVNDTDYVEFNGLKMVAYANLSDDQIPHDQRNNFFKLLNDQHPWVSPSLLYACFTGFFLFFSGIIAGYVQNKIRYGRIRERLNKHPVLRMSMKAKRLDRIAVYIEENAGTLFGNIALGFFLGFSGVMGKLLGIPFDIRHITISAANSAIGVYGLGIENIDPLYLLTVLGGVLGIGFLNFLVSFSLAFSVAVKSRGIRFRQYPRFLRILGRHFLKTPLDFFRPPKRRRRLE